MGLLFATNGSDEEFVPPSGMGSKSRAVPMDGVVDSPESVGALSSTRVQRKRRCKPFPDEAETELRIKHNDDDGEHESDRANSRTRAISAPAPALLDARPKQRRRMTTTTLSSSSTWTFCHHCWCKSRRPKMRCSDRRVNKRVVPQTVLRWLHRETVCRATPFHILLTQWRTGTHS